MTTQIPDSSHGDLGPEDNQGALPFGALPDSGGDAESTSTTSRKKAVRKKAAKKTAKKAASSEGAAAKPAKKTAAKKAVRKSSKAGASGSGEDASDDGDAPKPATRKKATRKKAASRTKVAADSGSDSGSDSDFGSGSEGTPVSKDVNPESDAPKRVVRKKREPKERATPKDADESASARADSAGDSDDRSDRGDRSDRSDRGPSGGSSESPSASAAGGEDHDGARENGRGPKRKRTRRSRRRRRSEEDASDENRDARDGPDTRPRSGSGPDSGSGESGGASAEPTGAGQGGHAGDGNQSGDGEGRGDRPRRRRRRRGRKGRSEEGKEQVGAADGGSERSQDRPDRGSDRGSDRVYDKKGGDKKGGDKKGGDKKGGKPARKEFGPKKGDRGPKEDRRIDEVEGMFFLEKGQVSVLRHLKNQWLPSKEDIYVPKKLVQQFKLHDGMIIKGPASRGFKNKIQLESVVDVDGHPPEYWKKKPFFKNLTSIDPDFHYAVGDVTDDVSMRVLDLIAPIGRGQRGLLVAPPRTGKTTLMRQFASGIEKGYPDVHLMVLLIDERPEEATEWKRSMERGEVFVSTADETAKNHISLAEVVWRRANRLVEMGEDVVLLMDSITRLARAYNNQAGAGSGRTMSGGLDSRAMERPRKFFGSARNTVEAGSLTILGTTLIETGSRMDQLVFEEFKGTGNMELVLNRKLADRRIFPAIDIEKSGTRKEEKLVGLRRLKLIHILRRVLARMHFAEAADLLITKLDDVAKTDDFLERFTVDPEA